MAVTRTNIWQDDTSNTGVSSYTMTVSGATAGARLTASVASRYASSTTIGISSNWTILSRNDSASGHYLLTRVATGVGTEDDLTVTASPNARPFAFVVEEWSGLSSSGSYDQLSTGVDDGAAALSLTISSITPTAQPGLMLTTLTVRDRQDWVVAGTANSGAGISVTGSFSASYAHAQTSNATLAGSGWYNYTSTTAVGATWSTTDTVGCPVSGTVVNFLEPSGAAYTLDLTAGSYTVTGSTRGLTAQRNTGLTAGSYTLTGSTRGLTVARNLSLTAGSYTVTGSSLTMNKSTALPTLDLTAGSYTVTGSSLTMTKAKSLGLSSGSYTITGSTVAFRVGRSLSLTAGSYATTGSPLGTLRTYVVDLATGAYTVSGSSVNLTGPGFKLTLTAGAYVVSGSSLTMKPTTQYALGVFPGAITVTGSPLNLEASGVNLLKINGTLI